MSQPHEPREIFPVVFHDGRPHPQGKDFSIRPTDAQVPMPDLEPAEVVEEVVLPDPKDYSAMGSAEFSDLIPSAAEAIPAGVVMDPEQTTTDPSKPTSSTSPVTGRSEPIVAPAPATTPTSSSATPRRPATKRSSSASAVQ